MSIQARSRRHRAFALVEVSAVVIILLLVAVIAGVLIPDARRRARLAGSIQNLQFIGKGAASFAADRENRVFSFDWEPGVHRCENYVFPASSSYNDAASDQAVCILRQRAGRNDITAIRGWVPFVLYNHLPLVDYLDESLPSSKFISPGDAPRLAWQRAVTQDPNDPSTPYFNLTCRPAGTGNNEKRWPYSSSYEVQPSFYSPDALRVLPGGQQVPTVAQSSMGHRYYEVGSAATVLGRRRMDEVHFPSHKAMMYETNQRFYGSRELFFMYDEARVPVLTADGGATVRSGANRGFHPNTPNSQNPSRVNYIPETSWETPTANGAQSELVFGGMRWTRSGLRGRDFLGPEVPWVP
jgi:hypothetical protein